MLTAAVKSFVPAQDLTLLWTDLVICDKLPAFQDLDIAAPKDTAWFYFWLSNINIEPAMTTQEMLTAKTCPHNVAGMCRCMA